MNIPISKPLGSSVIRNGIMGVSDDVLQGGNRELEGPGVTVAAVGSPTVLFEIHLWFCLCLKTTDD
ncbi:hypothetical protein HanPI659440_Chr12g0453301 [Helianthus annuus]|nr:hypothetical protein HanPI659440_Chr12g0453301 [Helianthus annuus]